MTPGLWLAVGAVVLPYVAHLPVIAARIPLGYERRHPREQSTQLTGWGARAWAAEQNAFEAALPAVVVFFIAHLTAVEPVWVWGLGLAWTVCRLGHLAAYVGNRASLRSTMFGLANLCLGGLLVLAALG